MRKRLKLLGVFEIAVGASLVGLGMMKTEPCPGWLWVVALGTLFLLGATTFYIAFRLQARKDYFY
jgi:hypothetical protein